MMRLCLAAIAVSLIVAGVLHAADAGLAVGRADPGVFTAPPAPMTPRLRDGVPAPGGPMRVLTVEERVGEARRCELVRVPLFFHDGECADPAALAVYAADDAKRERPIPYQADDIRRDPAGKVSRMHIYFTVDIAPWERKQFSVLPGRNPAAALPPMSVAEAAGRVILAGDDIKMTFFTQGPRAGAVAAVETPLGRVAVGEGGLVPRLTLIRQAADCKVLRSTPVSYAAPGQLEVRDLRWADGPLFAKLILRIGPKGVPDSAEFTYLVPRKGAEIVLTERLMPDGPETAEVVGASDNVLLAGGLVLGDAAADQQMVAVSAGLRRMTRDEHAYTIAALVNPKAGLSLIAVPYVLPGGGLKAGDAGEVLLNGPSFHRETGGNSKTLRVFWGQMRLALSKATAEEDLWRVARRNFQSLTAVVDEPGVTPDVFHADATEVVKKFREIKYWGSNWVQNAAMLYLERNQAGLAKLLEKSPKEAETTLERWTAPPTPAPAKANASKSDAAKAAPKKPANPGPGPLDPYMITYGASAAVQLGVWVAPSDRIDKYCRAVAQAERQANGRADVQGFPFIKCFATALNMQVGSYMMGIYSAKKLGDPDLLQYYRDTARTAPVLGIFGRGQRPYTGCITGPGTTDLLYECLSDIWLRSIELATGEDLWMHPAVFGRYFDCVDVTADLQHRTVGDPGTKLPSWWRANFFRGQSHDHRWENWDAAPYLGMFARAGDGPPVGLTEACYFMRHRVGRDVNWSELLPMFLADINLREGLRRYRPESAPPLPAGVEVKRAAAGNVVAWKPVAGEILGYRIYRAEKIGGPWTFVNSPYAEKPATLVAGTTFTDPEGRPGHLYFVTAVDKSRRESRWFPDEPQPAPGVGK
jgi:hypothetical protein